MSDQERLDNEVERATHALAYCTRQREHAGADLFRACEAEAEAELRLKMARDKAASLRQVRRLALVKGAA